MATKSLPEPWAILVLAATAPAVAQNGTGEQPTDPATHPYITPENGQTPQQQWADRYACDSWAKTQSGFDPASPTDSAASDVNASRRDQYRRALTACLEARGYEVSAPPPPPPPPSPVSAPPPPPASAPFWHRETTVWRIQHAPELKYHPLEVQIDGGYTFTTATTTQTLNGGVNGGLGFTLFPSPVLPLGLRVDGSYSRLGETPQSLSAAAQAAGTRVSFGNTTLYGGDADLELDLRMGPGVREYIFGGVGWYREQATFKQKSYELGVGCFYYCYVGYFPVDSTVSQTTTGWLNSWNAGVGFEFALADSASFFIEARYLRVGPSTNRNEFIPVSVGFRF